MSAVTDNSVLVSKKKKSRRVSNTSSEQREPFFFFLDLIKLALLTQYLVPKKLNVYPEVIIFKLTCSAAGQCNPARSL